MAKQNKDLIFLTLNAKNLFILSETPLTESHTRMNEHRVGQFILSHFENKPLRKIRGLVAVIEEAAPISFYQREVGGQRKPRKF